MGISIDAWRARVGSFSWSKSHSTVNPSSCDISKNEPSNGGFGIELMQILLILLVIGGIEKNPGPDYQCRTCAELFSSIRTYVSHQRIHSQDKNFRFSCSISRCTRTFSTLIAFKNHLTRDHGKQRNQSRYCLQRDSHYPQFTCKHQFCKECFYSMADLIQHTRSHLDNGQEMLCPFEGCNKIFHSRKVLNVHISRYHKHYTPLRRNLSKGSSNDLSLNNDDNMHESVPQDDGSLDNDTLNTLEDNATRDTFEDNIGNDEQCATTSKEVLDNYISKFYLKLEAKSLLPTSTVQVIVDDLKNITEIAHVNMRHTLESELKLHGIPAENIDVIVSKCMKNDTLYNIHNNTSETSQSVHSEHARKMNYKQNFNLVAPEEIYLGIDDLGKSRYAQYIPIKSTLETLLKDRSVQLEIDRKIEPNPNMLTDFKDGAVYKGHEIFSNEEMRTLQLFLYQDSFEVVNPLGSAKSKHKVLGVYFTLGNFHPHHRSNVDNLLLVMLVIEKDFKYFGQRVIWSRLLSDLKSLEIDGLPYKGSNIPAIVACILGDNLGSHCIGGFVENFSGNYFCRYCSITKTDFFEVPYQQNNLRTAEEYTQSVMIVNENPDENMTSHKGIKFDSVFNELKYFHVTAPGLPPCLGHDLFEGVVDLDLSLIITYLIKVKKWFTYTTINRRISKHKYLGSDSSNKPAPVHASGHRLGGHAAQNWCLLRLLPILIGTLVVDTADEVWQLYLRLKEICEFVCAPSISVKQVSYLQILIEEYLESRQMLFPNITLKPKHHFLAHYPQLILQFGPLIRLWTLRFESKHSYYKRCARRCNNFINIIKTLATRNQLHFAYSTTGSMFSEDYIFDYSTAYSLNNFDIEFHDALYRQDIPAYSIEVHKIKVHGITYQKGLWLTLCGPRHDMKVGKIITIIISPTNTAIFLIQKHIATFMHNLGIYQLNPMNSVCLVYECVTLSELKKCNYYPLPAYTLSGDKYIALKHTSATIFL